MGKAGKYSMALSVEKLLLPPKNISGTPFSGYKHVATDFLFDDFSIFFAKVMRRGLEELCFSDGLFADIVFRLEDGTCTAHKPILMAR